MSLVALILSSITLFSVITIFMSKNANNSSELSAYEDHEQMLALSGKLTQNRAAAKHANS